MTIRKVLSCLLTIALVFGFGLVTNEAKAAGNCSGKNKVVTNKEHSVQKQYVYLDSCNAAKLSAKVANKATNDSFMAALSAFIPGFQPFSVIGALSAKMESNKGNDIAIANSSGEGVVMSFEKDLMNKDSYMLWVYKKTASQ
ncbi:hypothetical protein [Pseudobacillus badius]|uniref:hypothetical protein n=1 Tax=Bacillus badius TaxID=1455 RepID=UPI0007B072E0|nr:hypothetical protein [Bacillus badius]KZN99266.1 hypothetical protein A4244_19315 [Bacillus badius]OCS84288.1 hypothetical protein A6M11_19330 [Bacillus badius]OVE47756.1 hypothetical protein B1A98_18245 [Bacillus badius]TDV99739.1 hypothetical protein B0G66_12019 [Bacillus badius]